jgi:hypothetical protein
MVVLPMPTASNQGGDLMTIHELTDASILAASAQSFAATCKSIRQMDGMKTNHGSS